jgi:hypothetical protein
MTRELRALIHATSRITKRHVRVLHVTHNIEIVAVSQTQQDLIGDEVLATVVAGNYGLKPIKLKGLTSKHPRIAKRLEEDFDAIGGAAGTKFCHLEPANYLRMHKELLESMTDASVAATVKLFDTLNALV